jgi:hypothetical protein
MHGKFKVDRGELLQDQVWHEAVKNLSKLNEVVELELKL